VKKEIIIILILTLIQGIAHNLAHPITPSFVSYLGIDDVMFGIFFASMSLGIVLGAPMWGIISDKGHHKTWIVIGNIMYAIGQLIYGYSEDVTWMIFARIFSGIGAASGITIFAALILIYSKKDRVGRNLALFGGSLTLGASLGYFLGGQLSVIQSVLNAPSYQYVFLIQSVLTLTYALLIFILVKNPTVNKETTYVPFYRHILSIFKMPLYQWSFYIGLLFATMSFTFVSKYLDVYFRDLGYDPNVLGTFVLFTGLISLITSLIIVPKLFKLKFKVTFFLLTLIGAVALWWTFQFTQILISLYTIFSIYIIVKTAHQPFEQSHISTFAKDDYGRVMGIRQLFIGLGMILGPILGSLIYANQRKLSFELASYLIVLSILLMMISIKKQKSA
jgi:DHA1 family multidrug resistance protein-like MFS transporter